MRSMRWRTLALFLFLCLAIFSPGQTATAPAVPVLSEPHHHLAVENEYIRAFKVEVPPHSETLLHRHEHDYVLVTLGAAHIVNAVEGKPPVDLNLADGETRFLRAPLVHVAKDLSDTPFRNITVELLQDRATREATTFPDVASLQMQKVLFVEDGMRASEIRLAPGATLPRHEHKNPHLIVAVDDLDMRSDVEGQNSLAVKLKAGDVKWAPGGYTHTLTNVGQQEARFVTLEF
jgi:quercetin dioxygenase-like cupin family protein